MSASNSIDFLANAEHREADLIIDRVFSLLQQRCAFGGVGEEAERLECEQVEIMSDSAAFGSRSPRVFMRFARPIISACSPLVRGRGTGQDGKGYSMEGSFLWTNMSWKQFFHGIFALVVQGVPVQSTSVLRSLSSMPYTFSPALRFTISTYI